MPLRRYVAATAVGAIAWAAVYTTVGMTILAAWLTAPIGRIVSVPTGTALVLIVMIRRSRSVRDDRSHQRNRSGRTCPTAPVGEAYPQSRMGLCRLFVPDSSHCGLLSSPVPPGSSPPKASPDMTTTLSRKRVLIIAIVSTIAVVSIIAAGLVYTGVFGNRSSSAKASSSTAANEPSDRFIVSYAENSAAAKVIASAKAYGENVLESLPSEDRQTLDNAAGKFSVKVENVTAHSLSTAGVKLSDKLTVNQVKEFISTLEAANGIESVEPDMHMTAVDNASSEDSNVPDDQYFSKQWDMTSGSYGVNATNAWSQSTGKGVTVAVIDTGILSNHPDFEGQLLPGYDFISDPARARDNDGYDADPSDEGDWIEQGDCSSEGGASKDQTSSWHGSHVAGTIAARTNNKNGVAGVAPDAKIVPVRVLGRCGSTSADTIDAVTWASGGKVNGVPDNENPARIINMSIGGTGSCPRFFQKTIDAAVARGSIIVAAAGNDDQDVRNVAPAGCKNVITVGASTKTGARSSFSNYGTGVDISAPGGQIDAAENGILSLADKSTKAPQDPDYAIMMGTSQATPHVSGTVALMLALNPDLKAEEVVTILQNTATPMAECDRKACGAGIVNAAAAVDNVSGKSPGPSTTASASPSASDKESSSPSASPSTSSRRSSTPSASPSTSSRRSSTPSVPPRRFQ